MHGRSGAARQSPIPAKRRGILARQWSTRVHRPPANKSGFTHKKKTAPWIGRGFVTVSEVLEASTLINGVACLFSLSFSQVAWQIFSSLPFLAAFFFAAGLRPPPPPLGAGGAGLGLGAGGGGTAIDSGSPISGDGVPDSSSSSSSSKSSSSDSL